MLAQFFSFTAYLCPKAAVSNGVTPRAAHTKNKTDREAYNGCCPCGHRDSPVCLCVYIDETMRGHAAAGAPRARRFPRARAGERRHRIGKNRDTRVIGTRERKFRR